jgi:hypothetical protein
MGERVQFAHMEFRAEGKRVNGGALKIAGKRMEFAADVGEMPFVQLRDNDATALHANFEPVEGSGCVPETVVGLIQRVEHLRVRRAIEAMRPEQKIESAEGLRNLDKLRVF